MRAPAGTKKSGPLIAADANREKDSKAVGHRFGAWQPRRGFWPTVVVLVAALLATVSVWRLLALNARGYAEREFEVLAQSIVAALRDRVTVYTRVLRGGAALFHSIDRVSRDTWRTYVGTLEIDKRYPGIKGVGFAAAVQPADIAAHISQIRGEGLPDYSLRPDGIRPFYGPIVYLEPEDPSNRRALGYDMFSEPVRRAAMESARDAGEARLSGKVTLAQDNPGAVGANRTAGILLYWPLYQPGARLATVDDRRASLRGWIYVAIRVDDFVRDALAPTKALEQVGFAFIDATPSSNSERLYDSADARQPGARASQFSVTAPFEILGRTWILKASSLPAFENSVASHTPVTVLAAGTLVSLLMASVVWSVNRRQVEATESAARLQLIVDATPSILWLATPHGTINWVSDSWHRYTGISAASGAHDIIEFVHPDDRERWRAWAAALRDGLAYEIEVRYRRHDGRYHWFITRVAPERDSSGHVVGWLIVTTDVDDLKRANQSVRESESRFRAVFNHQFQFMAILSPDGVVRACNDTFFAATGVSPEAVLGRFLWAAPWWSDLPEEQLWWRSAIEGAVTSGGAVTGEVALANADGSRCQAEFAVTGVRDEVGRVIDVVAEGRDITHRKQWEEQQKLLTKELAHRIKNSMAVIQSIARQTLGDAPKPVAEAFTGRIQSLAAAHEILIQKGWSDASLKELASRQLAVAQGSVRLAGPDVTLPPILATSLGLVLHELVTNATKYGALSAPHGVVELTWQATGDDGERRVLLTWKERGGPPIAAPDREGFGSRLIERSLPGANVERRFEREGLVCTIDVPLQ
ncbi:MAG TPA: CHASE domain-containing protein [Hyphomicrobiaceae bacterium]|nr:CHASE domain-containing protein [Hyphomicrobiaceae bacterium]